MTIKLLSKNILGFLAFVSLLFPATAVNAASLNIGEDINFEYRSLKRGDTESTQFRQDIKLYLEGYLEDNIEIGANLRSAGVMNSTAPKVNFEGARINNRIPFIENAYIKINDYYGTPLTLIFGKLNLNWQDGILINDNRQGLPGVRLKYAAPYGVDIEGYYTRAEKNFYGISDIRGKGLRAVRDFNFRNLELNYITEDYESTAEVSRRIYGGRFTRNMHRGMEYSLFGFLMDGEKKDETFDGHALGAYGKFEGVVDPIGKGGAWIEYILGTGDSNDGEKGFMPVLSSVEADLIGDYYGRNREYAYINGTKTLSLSHTIADLSLMRNALYATVLEDFHLFWIRSTYKSVELDQPLGGAITFGGTYNYSFIDFELRYTKFSPEEEYDYYSGDKSTEFITGSISAKF
ncbi:MAG: hypothetical protein ACQEQC_08720 [Elusimicrobiota bacterium]